MSSYAVESHFLLLQEFIICDVQERRTVTIEHRSAVQTLSFGRFTHDLLINSSTRLETALSIGQRPIPNPAAQLLNIQITVRVGRSPLSDAEKNTRRSMTPQLRRQLIQSDQRVLSRHPVAEKPFANLNRPHRVRLDVDAALPC